MSNPGESADGQGEPGVGFALAMLGLVTAVVADYAVFQLLDVNYFRWYVANGSWIALVVGGVAVAVDLERVPGLISVYPATFLAGCFELIGESVLSLDVEQNPRSGPRAVRAGPIDWIFGALFAIASVVVYVVWLIVIAPLQYFGNIVAGAPARLAVTSPWRSWVRRQEGVTVVGRSLAEKMPEGAEETGLARRPVALTSTITAGLLFVIGQFL
jgi:hypothetical protein